MRLCIRAGYSWAGEFNQFFLPAFAKYFAASEQSETCVVDCSFPTFFVVIRLTCLRDVNYVITMSNLALCFAIFCLHPEQPSTKKRGRLRPLGTFRGRLPGTSPSSDASKSAECEALEFRWKDNHASKNLSKNSCDTDLRSPANPLLG